MPRTSRCQSPSRAGSPGSLSRNVTASAFSKQALKVGDGFFQTVFECHDRSPVEQFARATDVRATLLRVVGRQWPVIDSGARTAHTDHHLGQLADRVFAGVSEID